jgi:glutaredoxin
MEGGGGGHGRHLSACDDAKPPSIAGLVLLVLMVGAAAQWWAGHSHARLGARMAALARPGDMRALSSRSCAFCTAARQWMRRHGVGFTECFIEADEACAAQFEAARAPGTPLLLARGQVQVGFDAQRVLDSLGQPAS